MKKIIWLIILLIVTGCTVVRIDTTDINNILSVVLSKDNKMANQHGKGYKYYIPRGVTYVDTTGYNEKLYSNGYYYFIYIDAVSYYHQVDFDYQVDEKAKFSKKIEANNKTGYLEINQAEGGYYIEFVYNYTKIEALVAKKDVEEMVLKASYILSTVQFNDKVIELLLRDDYFANREEVYNIFEPKKETNNFLQYEDE